MATNSHPFGFHFPAWFILKAVLLLLVLFLCVFPSGQPCQVIPALPSLFHSLGYFVLFPIHCHGYSLSVNPPLVNYFCKSPNCACYSCQNSLQVFGVFVLMECKKCTQYSRCALTHHACSKRGWDLMSHDVAPQCWQLQVTLAFLVASWHWDSFVITPGLFQHYAAW